MLIFTFPVVVVEPRCLLAKDDNGLGLDAMAGGDSKQLTNQHRQILEVGEDDPGDWVEGGGGGVNSTPRRRTVWRRRKNKQAEWGKGKKSMKYEKDRVERQREN